MPCTGFHVREQFGGTPVWHMGSRSASAAEGEGFEPPDLSVNGFQDHLHKPLGHPSEVRLP